MHNWRHKLEIRHLLTEDEDRESMRACAAGIALAASKLGIPSCGEVLARLKLAADLGEITFFNAALDDLWDWLDEERIWVP